MERYRPDMYKSSIFEVNYSKLKENGVNCLLFDLDNTILPYKVKEIDEKTKELFENLKKQEFKIMILSNSVSGNKVKQTAKTLGIDYIYGAMKPFKSSFKKALKKQNALEEEAAIIGDQIFTDIKGGNKIGITTVLVKPIQTKESFVTIFNRIKEKRIFEKMGVAGLLLKGRYYE